MAQVQRLSYRAAWQTLPQGDPNDLLHGRVSALYRASHRGHCTEVLDLLQQGEKPDSPGGDGRTPLMEAAQYGYVGVAEALLAAGANPNARTLCDSTPLHEAAAEGQDEVVRLLLESGAHLCASSRDGFLPLHRAAKRGHSAVVRTLLRHGADPNQTDKFGRTPLGVACTDGQHGVVEALLQAGADPELCSEMAGMTPLMMAVRRDHAEVAALLLRAGADPNRRLPTGDGDAALHLAARFLRQDSIKALLWGGADERRLNSTGQRPDQVVGVTHLGPVVPDHWRQVEQVCTQAHAMRCDAAWARRGWLVTARALHKLGRIPASALSSSTASQGPITPEFALLPPVRAAHAQAVYDTDLMINTCSSSCTSCTSYTELEVMDLAGLSLDCAPSHTVNSRSTEPLTGKGGVCPPRLWPAVLWMVQLQEEGVFRHILSYVGWQNFPVISGPQSGQQSHPGSLHQVVDSPLG